MLVWQSAREQAAEVLETHWNGGLPVDPYVIANALGIEVFSSDLGPTVSGEIAQTRPGTVRIDVSHTDSETRQAFTCAHEIGHFIERTQVARDRAYTFTDSRTPESYDLHEFFADEFAGALLMPEEAVKGFEAEGMSDLEMSRRFGVSLHAMQKRRERLRRHG